MPPVTPPISIDLSTAPFSLEARTTVRLHPRRFDGLDPTGSKVGGAFAWPADEPWPTCPVDRAPLVTVLQIRRGDVPELGFPEEAELFQLLWCGLDHPEHAWEPQAQIVWREDAPERGMCASEEASGFVPMECRIHPERVTEFPSAFELPLTKVDALNTWLTENARADLEALAIPDGGLYQYHFSVAPGIKIGGYPQWVQDPQYPTCGCGTAMDYLLTIDCTEFSGMYHRWADLEERRAFEADWRERRHPQASAELVMMDGTANVFACRSCEGWPTRAVYQT